MLSMQLNYKFVLLINFVISGSEDDHFVLLGSNFIAGSFTFKHHEILVQSVTSSLIIVIIIILKAGANRPR